MLVTSVQAQYDNLGDVLIRATLVEWLATTGRVMVVTGDAPGEYLDALRLPRDVSRVRSMRAVLRQQLSVPMHLIYAPGEQSLDAGIREWPKAALNLGYTVATRASGGHVLKVGRGYKGHGRVLTILERAQVSATNATWVRDSDALRLFPRTASMPDISLASTRIQPGARCDGRDSIVIALRGDRAHDFVSLRALQSSLPGLRSVVVVQVRRDLRFAERGAEELSAACDGWEGTMEGQLERVVASYQQARFVVSDRLHVLLFGLLAGAIPVGIETGVNAKLARQLRQIDLSDHVFSYSRFSEALDFVKSDYRALHQRCEASLSRARERLRVVQSEIEQHTRARGRAR